jgi:hypothetical protein
MLANEYAHHTAEGLAQLIQYKWIQMLAAKQSQTMVVIQTVYLHEWATNTI